jgi:hypothetical protein
MNLHWTAEQRRRIPWIVGGVAAVVVVLPLAPQVASGFVSQSASAHAVAPSVVHLEVVGLSTHVGPGQITQPRAGTQLFVACPSGRAIDGGYAVADDPVRPSGTMLMSAPAEDDPARWNFRFSGLMPIGTKLYTVCWAN